MTERRRVLMTGASGFLGKEFMKSLSGRGNDIYCLTRNSDRGRDFIIETLGNPHVHIVNGDITQPLCDINADELLDLSDRIDEVWHIAASTEFDDDKRSSIELNNSTGTYNILQTLEAFRRLRDFFYVSTAYVCGKKTGCIIPESDFDHADVQDEDPLNGPYKNPYEMTKHQCERLVRESSLPWTILRPSILIGDSRDHSSKGEGRMIYGYARAIQTAALHHFNRRTRAGPPSG